MSDDEDRIKHHGPCSHNEARTVLHDVLEALEGERCHQLVLFAIFKHPDDDARGNRIRLIAYPAATRDEVLFTLEAVHDTVASIPVTGQTGPQTH